LPDKFKNIFLKNIKEAIHYTSTGSGPREQKIPLRDRARHSTKLRNQFDRAWKEANEIENKRKAVSLATKEGIYLEFKGSPDQELRTKSLEDRRYGIKLLNIRKEKVNEKEITCATIYHKDRRILPL